MTHSTSGADRKVSPEAARRYRRTHYELQKSTPEGHARYLLDSRKKAARRKGVQFAVSLADLLPLPTHCPALGIPLAWCEFRHSGGWDDFSPSIDKVDPALGYVPGNVRVISMRANRMKSDGSIEELKAVVNYMEEAARV